MQLLKRKILITSICLWTPNVLAVAGAHVTEFNGHKAWIKTVPPEKQTLSFCAKKKIAARLSPIAIARPTPTCGLGILSLEAQRLKDLKKLGAPVPEILKESKDYLIIEDRGKNLEKVINRSPTDKRLPFILKAIESIKNLHALDTAHGRAMLKDMVLDDAGNVSFIDLAEDPLSLMNIQEAKARDWLMFLFSALPFCTESEQKELVPLVKNSMDAQTLKTFEQTVDTIKKFQDLLPDLSKWGGKDGARAAILLKLL